MKWRRIAIFAILQAQLPVTDAVPILGLTDPRLCYLLDGFLFIYAVIMTALFVKVKLTQTSEPQLQPGQDDVYNKLSRGQRDEYDVLGGRRGADPELGGRHQQRRKNPQDTVYTSLQKDKMGEAYSEIGMKGEVCLQHIKQSVSMGTLPNLYTYTEAARQRERRCLPGPQFSNQGHLRCSPNAAFAPR